MQAAAAATHLQDLQHDIQVRVSELSLAEAELLEMLHDREGPGQGLTTCMT